MICNFHLSILSEQIRHRDTLACCWELKQATNKQILTAVKADEMIQATFVPTVDQAEEEKTPYGCEGRRGHTQFVNSTVQQAEGETSPNGCKSGWGRTKFLDGQTWVEQICQLGSYRPQTDNCCKTPVFQSWKLRALMARGKFRTYASFDHTAVQMTLCRCGVG